MINETVLQAAPRTETGKNAARRLRAAGRMPATVYGGSGAATSVSINTRELGSLLRQEGGRQAIFTLAIDGADSTPVKIHRYERDPITNRPLHLDFVRVSMTEKTKVQVPLEFTGEPLGVKQDGGMLEVHLHQVEIECFPRDIPASLQVDISTLPVGSHLYVRDIPVDPDNITIVTDGDHLMVSLIGARTGGGDEEETEAEGGES
jgi:large subunit ribosomal protein L25